MAANLYPVVLSIRFIRRAFFAVVFLVGFAAVSGRAQTLNLPARASNAPTGTEFVNQITPLSLTDRENAIFNQIANGNIPGWLRTLVPVTTNAVVAGTNRTVTYYVTPDYLAIGSDTDYFLTPMTPLLAQRVMNYLGGTLPTRKMVNDIWKKAPCHLAPSPISPSPAMTTVPIFAQHNTTVRGQRYAVTNTYPLGTLTGGDKKDVIISHRIYTNFASQFITKPVVIYGWHQLNGVNIQPLYNGHEETYADYSHGIRFVQMAMTLDGQPNTVTNVVMNPLFAGVLSDDTYYSASTFVLPKPYYTIAQTGTAPVIVTAPFSQTVSAGANVTFSVTATGTAPLLYQWQRNGVTVANATNATLVLTNVQSANAGTYTVLVSNGGGSIGSLPAVLRVNTTSYPVLFSDNFDTNSSANWNLFWGATDNVADYTVDWAFNYGTNQYTFNGATNLIPPSPSAVAAGTTRGVRFTVNNNDAVANNASVNIYPKNRTFSGNYAMKFEMWLQYPGNSGGTGTGVAGSTEHAIFGLNHLGTRVNWAATSATGTDGLWFGVDGEGGTARDYRQYVGNPAGVQTELLGPTSGLAESNNAAGMFPTLFPASRFESAGSPGKNWVAVELTQLGGLVTWKMDGTVVAQRTNTSSFTNGNVMLGFMDTFSSIAAPAKDAFVLFDNLRVEDLSGGAQQPPAITVPPSDQQCQAGTNVTFTVTATGTAPLQYQWQFNNQPISGATNSALVLSAVQAAQSGQYTVTVNNSAGSASATVLLTVLSSGSQFEGTLTISNGQFTFGFAGLPGEYYVVETSTNMTTWKPLTVLAGGSTETYTDAGSTNFFSGFYRAYAATNTDLTDFEGYTNGATVLFNRPLVSGSTSGFLDTAVADSCLVTNVFPGEHDGSSVLRARWAFKTGTTDPWLRLTTVNAVNLPNPIIGTNQAVVFDLYTERDLYVTLGVREANPTGPIGGNGGVGSTPIEWLGGTTANTNPPKGRRVTAGNWTTLTFFLPFEPCLGFFNGNGSLNSTTGKAVLEHLCLVPADGAGIYTAYLDNFRVVDLKP